MSKGLHVNRKGLYRLHYGKHNEWEALSGKRCAMEWVAFIAGEEHSDHPECVSPLLSVIGMTLNDITGATRRQDLRPYLARMIGTRGDRLDRRRARTILAFAEARDNGRGDFHYHVESAQGILGRSVRRNFLYDTAECDSIAHVVAGLYRDRMRLKISWQELLGLLNDLLPAEFIELPEPVALRAAEVCGIAA